MKFYVNIVVHQTDSTQPDYQYLHRQLMEVGFVQRGLDGTLALQPTSGLYQREDSVLGRTDIEFDLRTVLDNFPHLCSFELEQASSHACAPQPVIDTAHRSSAETGYASQSAGTLIH